eukprot:1149076-Pelagomonas_calceolata.AAC.5
MQTQTRTNHGTPVYPALLPPHAKPAPACSWSGLLCPHLFHRTLQLLERSTLFTSVPSLSGGQMPMTGNPRLHV